MTSEPANVLIAGLCLISLVLAGGASQALIPGDPQAEFVIQIRGPTIECPENRVIRPCQPVNLTERETIDLFQSLRDFFIIDGVSLTVVDQTRIIGAPQSESTRADSGSTESTRTPPNSETKNAESTASTADSTGTQAASPNRGTATRGSPTPAAQPTGGAGKGSASPLDWLLWPALLVVALAAVAGVLIGVRRGAIDSPRQLRRLPGLAMDAILGAVVGVAATATRSFRHFWIGVIGTVRGFATTGSLPEDQSLGSRLTRGLDTLLDKMRSAVSQLLGRPRSDTAAENASGASVPGGGPQRAIPEEKDAVEIRTAWRWLANRTRGGDTGPRTPDDIARAAIDRGYPQDAVRTLLRAFHDVTYGEYPPTDDRRRAAREAVERLRQAERSSEGGRR